MFCPICKSEHREGFETCSDCHVDLVDQLPAMDSPHAFEVLWSGESAVFQDRLLEELEQQKISAAGMPLDVLFRNSGDVLGLRREPRFGLAVCVQKTDLPAARKILEHLLEQEPGESTPESESIPFSSQEDVVTGELPLDWDSATASIEVWKGEEESRLKFIEDALNGVGIPTLRVAEEGGVVGLMVRPEDEARGNEVVRQILETSAPDKALPGDAAYAWLDEPVKSYALIWIGLAAYLFLGFMVVFSPEISRSVSPLFEALAAIATFAEYLGFIWMFYQAARYEIRPFRFIILNFVPFSFIWYYFERYSKRTGVRRLPVAMRIRISPPPSV
jgi:hypothetical protein